MNIFGWIKERIKRRLGVPSVERSLAALAGRGFRPDVVFDVGAYHGDFAAFCRALFRPTPRLICFEPLTSAIERLKPLEARGEITLIPGLVGDADSERVEFHEMETASSVLLEHQPTPAVLTHHPMRRLDT
jgi:FkbM family methyltransferase